MPAITPQRQPEALAWFASAAGQAVLDVATPVLAAALAARPVQPWLWIAPLPACAPPALPGQGLRLHPVAVGHAGDLRCGLPMPLASESLGNIVIQYPQAGVDELLDECARVLVPGGHLWLCTLNPWSPYRWRWQSAGLAVRDARHERGVLQRAGLTDADGGVTRRFGPVWRMGGISPESGAKLGATCLLEMEKRVAATIPMRPEPRRWRPSANAGLTPS